MSIGAIIIFQELEDFHREITEKYLVPEGAKVQLRWSHRAKIASVFVSVPDDGPDQERIDFQRQIYHPLATIDETSTSFAGMIAEPALPGSQNPTEPRYVERTMVLVDTTAIGEWA
ncbi:MAG: hypothetical protein ACOH1Y_14310 [Propionicimonas sp.]